MRRKKWKKRKKYIQNWISDILSFSTWLKHKRDRKREGQTDRLADRARDRERERGDRQTGRHINTNTERGREQMCSQTGGCPSWWCQKWEAVPGRFLPGCNQWTTCLSQHQSVCRNAPVSTPQMLYAYLSSICQYMCDISLEYLNKGEASKLRFTWILWQKALSPCHNVKPPVTIVTKGTVHTSLLLS